jgi:serine/threonine protein kinase
MDHPSIEQLDAILSDTSDADSQAAIMAHLDTCPDCLRRFLSRQEAANGPPPWKAVGVDRHPDYRESLANEIKLAAAGRRATGLSTELSVHTSLRRSKTVGVGGFGQVFEYTDHFFGRPVAVKILQDRWINDAEAVQRFQREMEITASIDHPGCPAVYASGAIEDGRQFFCMQLVTGQPLNQMIQEAHKTAGFGLRRGDPQLRHLLNGFLQICDVIGVAHEKGIFHRDLKPANIRQHENQFPVVLDWGMAVRRGQVGGASPPQPTKLDAEGLTKDGEMPGTLLYIAPEAARGELDRIDHLTDIYGLGGILYEILSGKPPHAALLGSGGAPDKLIEQLKSGYLPPMSRLPAELASICRKALAAVPKERYATARELARDVGNWLAGEPVSAHQYSLSERGTLAVRRRPRTAAFAAIGAVALSLLAVLARFSIAEASKQRSLADDRFDKALGAWTAMITDIQDSLGSAGNTGELRKRLIQTADKGIRELLVDAEQQPGAELTIIQGKLELAHILRQEEGKHKEAEGEYKRLYETLKGLDKTHDVPQRFKLMGDALKGIIECRSKSEGVTTIEPLEAELNALGERFFDRFPGEPVAAMFRSQIAIRTGQRMLDQGADGNDGALRQFQIAEQLLLKLADSVLERHTFQHDLLISRSEQARCLFKSGKVKEAVELQGQVTEGMRALCGKQPLRRYRVSLITDEMTLGTYLKKVDGAKAIEQLKETLLQAESLNEGDIEIKNLARDCFDNLATAYRNGGQPEVAAKMLGQRVDNSLDGRLDSADVEELLDQAFVRMNLGRALQDLGRVPETLSQYRQTIALRRAVLKRDPKNGTSVTELLRACQALGDVALGSPSTSEQSKCLEVLESTLQTIDSQAEADGFAPGLKRDMVFAYFQSGSLALSLGSPSSLGHFTRCKALAQSLPGFPPARLAEVERFIQAAKQLPDGV